MEFLKEINKLANSEQAIGGLYVGALGALAGEILPTPSDPIDFWLERKWRIQLEKGEISPKKYWDRILAKYYFLDSAWWIIVFTTAILVKGDVKKKMIVVGSLVGAGAAIGMISTNVKRDVAYFEKYKLVPKNQ